ncbi:hypothetical protein FQZ97_1190730 [compost metagenome]
MRCACALLSRTNCLRVRVSVRSSCTATGGTKLARIRPWASRSAIHIASLTSVLRPGTFFTCAALASTSSKWPSSTCHTGFQYTPVASMATTSTWKESSQSHKLSRAEVVVAKVRTSCNGGPSPAMRTHATTVCL